MNDSMTHMGQMIVMLLSRDVEFTKHRSHNGDMWVVDNITAQVEIYFNIAGEFLYMNPLDRL